MAKPQQSFRLTLCTKIDLLLATNFWLEVSNHSKGYCFNTCFKNVPLTLPCPLTELTFVILSVIRTEVRGFGLTEITVKVSTMRLLQPSAEAKIRELDVSSGIQKQIVRLNVPVQNPQWQQIKLPQQLLCSRTWQYILSAVSCCINILNNLVLY
jgi:hypothetical protein